MLNNSILREEDCSQQNLDWETQQGRFFDKLEGEQREGEREPNSYKRFKDMSTSLNIWTLLGT